MKNFIIVLNIIIILWVTSIFSIKSPEKRNDRLVSAFPALASGVDQKNTTDHTGLKQPVPGLEANDDIYRFIREASEARSMDLRQGKLAEQRATTRSLKDYGTLMIRDQASMLDDLKKIATLKKIEIDTTLGPDKSEGLQDLMQMHGRDFDNAFMRMMIIDHRRDVKKFEKALTSPDPDIQVFATKYLPLVKSHLEKIRSIKKG